MATAKKVVPIKAAPSASKSTAVAVKKSSGGAVVSIQDALRAQAAATSERTAPSTGINIRLAGKQFAFPDGTKHPGPVDLVIVDFVSRNDFYEGAFDKENVSPPACFAIGANPLKLVPSDNSPSKQADTCAECPMNQFGSNGKGKACKNGRLLAVLPADAKEGHPLAILKVSPTGTKSFDGFVKETARAFQMPPVGVVVSVSFDENEDYPKLVFGDAVPNENVADHFARQEEAKELLSQEPDVSNYEPPKKAAARRR